MRPQQSMDGGTERISIAEAEALIVEALLSCGVPSVAARSVARALVAAEAEGQSGHGFSRLADYAAQVRSGKINPHAEVNLSAPKPAALMIDADHGFAYPALDQAIDALAPLAASHGVATAGISRSHHCGALSVQVARLAEKGVVGMMFANAPAAVAPWGAREPLYGTNPIAFAVPRSHGPPLVIDLSLSKVARGKVMHARKTSQAIPEGWALDSEGQPTTDPEAALAGTMVPIGEAKGTALALMVEVFAAAMTGANFSTDAGSFFTATGDKPGTGQFLIAFYPPEGVGFVERAEALLRAVEQLEGARLPGSRRAQSIERARREGLVVPVLYLDAARKMTAACA
ncbi:MAG: Ldh family oxidoreductase [Pseudomonadota bacterium]